MIKNPKSNFRPQILVVDDLEENLHLLEAILQPTGVNLILARSGEKALKLIAGKNIALALIDVHMPEMNGFELAQRIQKPISAELIPVIFITAQTVNQSELEKYYSKGVVDFISKPFKKNILLSKVNVLLELSSQKMQILEQKAEIENMVDELKAANRSLSTRFAYENLIAKISEMAVSEKSVHHFISTSLQLIGRAIGASRTYIIEYCKNSQTLCNTHEWCAHGISPQKENIQALPVAEIPWWHKSLLHGKAMIFDDVDDIPDKATKSILKAQDILSILVVPLFANGIYYGHIGFDFCLEYRYWKDSDVELLISISRILSSVIEQNIAEAEIMSKIETEHALINASLDSVFVIEPDGVVVANNQMMAQRLELGQDELIGKCVFDLLPDEVATFRQKKVDEVLRTGLPVRFQDRRDALYFEHSLYPIKDSHGKVYRIAIFGHDITADIQAENALRESEKMYRTLLSASPQGIFILDMKRKIIEISDITVEIFGAGSVNDFIGKDFFSIIPVKKLEKLKTILSKTLSDGLVESEEVILEKKNKTPFIIDLSATLIQENDGTPKAYMIIIRDISQKKIMEQQLIRTDRLISLGEMASGIAHEINQPLLSIQLGIENILNKIQQTNTADKNYLKTKSEKIFEDIVRIIHIIDHIRAFSRDQKYIYSTFNINDSIRNAVSMISQQFKQHGIKLKLNLSKECAVIKGNTYRFEQVILNLLSNAKDAIEEKSGTSKAGFDKHVVIRSYLSNNSICIELIDNGCGIDENDIDRILSPFYTTKKSGRGTGLGLAISFGIIKEFDGNIEIEGTKGLGSTFRILLPTK